MKNQEQKGSILRQVLVKGTGSLAVSALFLGLLFGLVTHVGGGVSAEALVRGIQRAWIPLVVFYALCQLVQGALRAWRTRMLLRAALPAEGVVPRFGWLALITFVRSACVDMLPARLGELSYVLMLKQGCGIRVADGLSTLSLGIYFDFAALLVVLVTALGVTAGGIPLWGAALLLLLLCAVGYVGLFYVLPWLARWIRPFQQAEQRGIRQKGIAFCIAIVDSIEAVKRHSNLFHLLLVSAGIRAVKYIGLYGLFLAVTRPMWPALSAAPVASVLIALIAAEGAASLPVPAFMSFGTYEAGGLAALTVLGFAAGESMLAMLAMHVLSQVVDYTLGGLAFLVFLWLPKKKEVPMSSSTPLAQRNRRLRRILQAALFLFLLSGVLVYAAWEWRAFYKQGRLTAPPPGTEGALTPEEAAHLEKVVQGLNARVVWSSNRAGTHDLWMLELPARTLSRLTRDEFTDTFPRFSPDGKQLLFMRSQQPWISQRNGVEWDTWNLDLQSGVETRVATNATMAVWHPDGERIFFTRNNSQVVEKRLADGVETIRLESGKGSMPEGVALPNVSVREGDPWLALTLRGKIRATAVVNQQGEWTKVGDGCQIFWHPGGSGAIYVDGPGMMKNAIYSLSEPGWERTLLLDAPEPFSHEYFPWLSDDGQYLVYGASAGGHEHDVADYEIFLWRVGDPPENVVRLTAHSGNDNWPDIHIP